MAKLRRDARTLRDKAISSLKRGIAAFNSHEEDGRITAILLSFQHSAEMIIKAILVQRGINVFNKATGYSLGFEKSLNLSMSQGVLASEAGTLRTIDSLRDAAQHWIVFVDEQILYLHARAAVTCIDDLLKRFFGDSLASHLPVRVLPISTEAPKNIDFLIDSQFKQIGELLKPGRRARDEARGRIRGLLALESHTAEKVDVSEKDIDRVEKAIRTGEKLEAVFPRLLAIDTRLDGDGLNVRVHFSKKDGAPVRFIGGDEPGAAAAVREVDLQKKYHSGRKDLAKTLGLSEPRSTALRDHLSVDEDPECMHVFEHGKSKFPSYSDNAIRKMKHAVANEDMNAIWAAYQVKSRFGGRGRAVR